MSYAACRLVATGRFVTDRRTVSPRASEGDGAGLASFGRLRRTERRAGGDGGGLSRLGSMRRAGGMGGYRTSVGDLSSLAEGQ